MGVRTRQERLDCISDIIRTGGHSNQESLLEELQRRGHPTTQATLSRDLRYLGIGKESDGSGGYRYTLPRVVNEISDGDYVRDLRRGLISYDFSGTICSAHTLPGHANSVAMAIDRIAPPEVIGTIAGDDTIFIILKEDADRRILRDFFAASCLPEAGGEG